MWTAVGKRRDKSHDGVVGGAERFEVEWHQWEHAKRFARCAKAVALATRNTKRGQRVDNDSTANK